MRDKQKILTRATEFRAMEENEERVIEGYFAVFDGTYELWPGATESIDRNAFEGELDGDVRALIDHDTRLVLGRTIAGTLTLRVDTHGLWGRIVINPDDQDAVNLYARVKRGDVSQCSFGFEILDEERTINESTGDVHWLIKRVKLYEVSVCTFPAYQSTSVSARADEMAQVKKRQFENWKENLKARLSKNGSATNQTA
mgnify:CR=1 FL=1